MDQRRIVFGLVEFSGEVSSRAVRAAINPVFFAVLGGESVRLFRVGASEVSLALTPAFDARKPNKSLHGTPRIVLRKFESHLVGVHELMR